MLDRLIDRVDQRDFTIGIIGLGYVGLPLALTAVSRGFRVLGFDVEQARVDQLMAGQTVIKHIPGEKFVGPIADGKFEATADMSRLGEPDAVLIAVPTPLDKHQEPDLTYVEKSTEAIAATLRPGQLVVLESTTWPGTTREVMQPILEAGGLKAGTDFFLAFSPEREDPGNPDFSNSVIPKVVGADDQASLDLAVKVYDNLVSRTVPVTSSATAEAVKLTENIFRSVNIALVNELKMIFDKMDINVWEVIEAAKSKPFGYMAFYPGPGLGGHCIPIDPFYLTWKAREFESPTRFIELAGQINTSMPRYVIDRLAEALDRQTGRGLNGSKILLVGMAYKKNVDDMRESPALKLTELLEHRGATVDYHDPHIPEVPMTRDHPEFAGRKSVDITAANVAAYDVVLVATDHADVDWDLVVDSAKLVVDTRNVCRAADNVARA
ncbi:nucleotide sugar dehydrogenase [Sphingomonas sp. G-3-2-10]|uniref:nucleotide sugar dehydrogenase n=1 Tax=Sphingomonas sp. G-3-2-10 TaxID=2728838 RepID=UPI00146AEB78|nr:nucleotide sugar dehydrogenase [Sphingomonas sp. G-3-2-10]NML06244.1 nucleotide sugar dehydrogenase [Sphingomonas sp. G-3-2-10]